MTDEKLMQAAAAVDVIDLAGAIIARPRHAMVSTAGQLALAHAVERFWEIAIEAEVLARAARQQEPGQLRDLAIETQAIRVNDLMIALRNTKENDDGQHD